MIDNKKMSVWDIENALLGEILCIKNKYSSNTCKYSIVRVDIDNSGTNFTLGVLLRKDYVSKYYFNFQHISDLINGKTVTKDGWISEYKIKKV